jgi:hypothetical protein
MPAPIVVPIAVAIARAIAAQSAKQGVKQLSKSQTKRITKKVIASSGGRRKVSSIEARRIAEQAAGPKARRLGGNKSLRAVAPKPDVRITTKAGKYRGYGTLSKEKTTVTRPVKRTTNKSGSAITVRKTEPRKAAEVRAERAKAKRDKLREALTPRVNPARSKIQPKRGKDQRDERTAIERDEPQGITIRGKFYPDGNRGLMPRGKQPTIESRVASRVEKPTRGKTPSEYDKEAGARIDEALKPSSRVKATVKPGKPTKTTIALRTVGGKKSERTAKLKGTIRNQRKVLKERELREAGERIRKAEEAAKIREAAAKRSGKSLLKGRVIKNTGAQ